MNNTEVEQLILDIITKAQEGKALQFQLITSWDDFIYYGGCKSSTKLVIKTLRDSANNLFKEYCRDVVIGTSEVTKLLAYTQLLDIITFYENDLLTIQQMLDEYDAYLGDWGNFWNAIFGGRREL